MQDPQISLEIFIYLAYKTRLHTDRQTKPRHIDPIIILADGG